MLTVLLLALLLQSPYSRADWPHWQGGCLDTRERVLIEESRRPVVRSRDGCTILSGDWLDPYTGESVTTPSALDVDHVISLKAAHQAGGWRWNRERRRAYANSLVDADHLVAVQQSANRAKGSKGPSRWLPPRKDSHCWYATTWARIAKTWGLTLPAEDRRAIAAILRTCS